jgi:hypothetical protein
MRDSGNSFSIVYGYGLDDLGSIPGRGERVFPLAFVSRPALGLTQPPVKYVPRAAGVWRSPLNLI